MKTLLNPWFVISCIVWAVVLGLRKLAYPLPYINGYINDLLAIPVIANLLLWFQRLVVIKNDYYVLAKWHVLFVVVYVSLIFEGLLPLFSKTYTGDPIDVLFYCIGGLFFYLIMNKPVFTEKTV